MKSKYWKGFVVSMMMLGSYSAQASAKLSLVGLGDAAKPKGNGYSEKMAPGGGLLIDINTGKKGSLELGLLYAPKRVTYSKTYGTTAATTAALRGKTFVTEFNIPTLEIPLLMRLWFNRVLSFGVGPVAIIASNAIGKATINTTRGAQKINGDTIPVKGTGFAAEASMKILLPFTQRFGLVMDGRYLYGLNGAKWQEIQGIAGFCFGNNTRGH